MSEIWGPAWSSANTTRFTKGIFFLSSLDLFSFFYQRPSSAFDFSTSKQLLHEQRASTREFFKVRGVNKIWKKNVKNEPHQEWLPQKVPQGTRLRPRL